MNKKLLVENLILYIVNLAQIARREGLLALEENISFLNKNERNALRNGLQLVIDGTDSIKIGEYFDNFLQNSKGFNKILLKIVKSGVMSIQYGDNPRVILLIISSIVPKKYYPGNLFGKEENINLSFEEINKRIFE